MQLKKPNILFLLTDQQQQSTILDGSQCLMPNIARLRSMGTTFVQARTVNAICAPARASLMTGMYPHNHGMVDNPHCVESFRADFQKNAPMLSEQLKRAGYRLGYFGKWHVERSISPASFGFDEAVTENHGRDFPRTLISEKKVQQKGYNDRTLYGVHSEGIDETEECFFYEQGMDFISRSARPGDEPWCVFISTNAPHDPYIAPKAFYELYDPASLKLPASFGDDMMDKPAIYRRLLEVWSDLTEQDYREALACYYANCTLVDVLVGRMLDFLTSRDLVKNTIIVFLSDHGDMMGGHGLLCKGIPAFEETYSIPCIMAYPGVIPAGAESGLPVSTVDIAPTVLDFSGVPGLPGTDGESLVPEILRGQEKPEKCCYAEFYGQRLSCSQRLLWRGGYKYVFNGFDYDELYDLGSDPSEMSNLIPQGTHGRVAEEMAREMWNIAKKTGDTSLLETEYFMFRFAPVGPEKKKTVSVYNRGA